MLSTLPRTSARSLVFEDAGVLDMDPNQYDPDQHHQCGEDVALEHGAIKKDCLKDNRQLTTPSSFQLDG